jgi:DNA-binding HxlR family transcriptional regulator
MARALEVLGDVWTFLVLREVFFRERRFEAIQRRLGIARTSLSVRLASLVEAGVLDRRKYSEKPPRFEYRLTDKGLDLYPALVALMVWGDNWVFAENGPPLRLRHRCGHALAPTLVCSHCHGAIRPNQVTPEAGPGFDAADEAPRATSRATADPALYMHGRICSVAQALAIMGDRWSFQILRAAFFGVRRFDEFAALLAVARNILTVRLARLTDEGIFERRPYQDRPPRFEYVLTRKGLAFYDSCLLLVAWGDRWTTDGAALPLHLRHQVCGQLFTPTLVCGNCGDPVRAREVTYEQRIDGPPPS